MGGGSAFWEPDATFSSQPSCYSGSRRCAHRLDEGITGGSPDGHEVRSFATDVARNNVAAYGVFHGPHRPGGPVPTGGVSSDYVYVMQFEGDRSPT